MAKTKQNDDEAVVPTTAAAPLAVVHDYGTMAGGGFENTSQSDFAIPLLTILQDLSPQVKKSDENYIAGAEAGMLFDTVTKQCIPGDQGVIFVPVVTQHVYVEFTPRDKGGGFRGVHQLDSEVVKKAIAGATKFAEYHTDEGNELTETFYLFGYTLDSADAIEPLAAYVVPFTSAKIKVYKRFMQLLRTFKGRPPLFANRLRLRTKVEKNPRGSFFNFDIAPLVDGDVGKSLIPPHLNGAPHPLLLAAKQFAEDVLVGRKSAAQETASAAPSSDEGGGDKVFS